MAYWISQGLSVFALMLSVIGVQKKTKEKVLAFQLGTNATSFVQYIIWKLYLGNI